MKPPPSEEFAQWAVAELKINPQSQADKNWINTNINAARSAIQNHAFFAKVQSFLTENRAKNKASAINIIGHDFALDTKSFESVVSKLFRANILDNSVFPTPPEGGWINSLNLFDRLNDLVRTTVTCRYFNEPRQISEAVANIAREHDLEVVIKAQARDVGYYAYHVYVRVPMTLVTQQWEEFEAKVQFELQVSTEMQYMLYDLTHRFYEKERHEKPTEQHDWKWDHKSPRFSASYISHSLHLLEGLIQRLYEDETGVSETKLTHEAGPADEPLEPRQ